MRIGWESCGFCVFGIGFLGDPLPDISSLQAVSLCHCNVCLCPGAAAKGLGGVFLCCFFLELKRGDPAQPAFPRDRLGACFTMASPDLSWYHCHSAVLVAGELRLQPRLNPFPGIHLVPAER